MDDDDPLISICIPCHNCDQFIDETINSVLNQTWRKTEIIAVDDGSVDCTYDILVSYQAFGVRSVRQENLGAASARNKAMSLARGEFILFLDADDLIGPDHLKCLLAVLPSGSRGVAMSQWDRFVSSPNEASFPQRPTYRNLPGLDWLICDWKSGAPMTQSGMFLLPRSLIMEAGGWNENLSLIDDFEFFARMICMSDGVYFAEGAHLFYRSKVFGSLSSGKDRRSAESAFNSLMMGVTQLLSAEDSTRSRHAAANVLQTFIYTFFPRFPDLRGRINRRIAEIGGADLEPPGPPSFHKLRRWVGWRAARLIQLLAERWGLNSASRKRRPEPGYK